MDRQRQMDGQRRMDRDRGARRWSEGRLDGQTDRGIEG